MKKSIEVYVQKNKKIFFSRKNKRVKVLAQVLKLENLKFEKWLWYRKRYILIWKCIFFCRLIFDNPKSTIDRQH